VTMLALQTETTDGEAATALRDEGITTVLVPRSPARVPRLTPVAITRALTRDIPLAAAKYYLRAYRQALVELLESAPFDLIHFEMVHMAQCLPTVRRFTNAPVLLSTQNVDSDVWRRAAEHQPTRLRRAAFGWQASVFERAERREGPKFDGVTAASDRDADMYRALIPGVPVETVDNGVDLSGYTPRPEDEEPATFVYTGSYDWLPNADTVAYFCREIWGRIRQALPDARFFAVGKAPTEEMLSFHGQNGITVTGRVPEVHPFIARAAVYVVPLRIGGGTRLKILEAMGMGKAIVSSSIGSEALDVEPDRDLLIADDAEEFAAVATALAEDVDRRRDLGAAGRRRVEERYGWEAIGDRMNAFYHTLIGDESA
ncbi:MAG: glycosyltransferase family 4 protein, partial [Candidatus Poribacteria bacterium]